MENRTLLYDGREIEVMPYVHGGINEKYQIIISVNIFPFATKFIIEDTINLARVSRIYFPNTILYKKVFVESISRNDYGYVEDDAVIAFDNVSDMVKYKLTC